MRRLKIIVVVECGVVQEIRSDAPAALDFIEVELLDMDNVEAGNPWHGMTRHSQIDWHVRSQYPHSVYFD